MSLHDIEDLRQRQSLPLQAKILMTQRRIREWVDYWHDDVYVSFSGGKDSTVLKHIVDSMYDNIPAVFVNDAGAEWTVWRAHGRKTIKIQLSKVALPA